MNWSRQQLTCYSVPMTLSHASLNRKWFWSLLQHRSQHKRFKKQGWWVLYHVKFFGYDDRKRSERTSGHSGTIWELTQRKNRSNYNSFAFVLSVRFLDSNPQSIVRTLIYYSSLMNVSTYSKLIFYFAILSVSYHPWCLCLYTFYGLWFHLLSLHRWVLIYES